MKHKRFSPPALRGLVFGIAMCIAGCAEFGVVPPAAEVPPAPALPAQVEASVDVDNMLPPIDAVMVAYHRQCEAPASNVAVSGEVAQLRELMTWLKRNCALTEHTTPTQLQALKRLRMQYRWPDSYAAWLDEWRRELLRLAQWQQRSLAAEAEQTRIVKKLKAIENDLISRP